MRILISASLLLISISVSAQEMKKLVIIGDSLTEGYGVSQEQAYPALLQKKIDKTGKKWRVINSGIAGSTSASASQRLKWALKQKPNMVIIALGTNDGLRGQDVKGIEKNLAQALRDGKNASVKIVLAGLKMPPNYGKAYATQFADLFPRVAAKEGVTLIPFLLDGVAGKPELNQPDGIHPNEDGHAIVAEVVFKTIESLL